MLAGEGWHAGVIGIVASRLVERTGRPVVLIALAGETGKGSGRSIEAFDLLAGLTACGAAPAALRRPPRRGRARDRARAHGTCSPRRCRSTPRASSPAATSWPVERVDAVVGGEELGMDARGGAAGARALRPRQPGVSLMVADATLHGCAADGRRQARPLHGASHGARARAVAFGGGARLPVADGEPAEATFTLEVNEWNGVSEPRLVLRRACPAYPAIRAAEEVSEDQTGSREELVLFALP